MKQTAKIFLGSIADVKDFVNLVIRYSSEVDLISDRYVVDAKSILGVFSLDLSKPITVSVDGADAAELMEALTPYLAE